MLRYLPLIVAMAFATTPNAWAAATVEPDAAKQTQEPKSAKARPPAASAPASKTVAKRPVSQRSVPAANPDANPFSGKAPPLGLCDGS